MPVSLISNVMQDKCGCSNAVRIIFLHFTINIIRFTIAMHFRGTVCLGNAVMYNITQQTGMLLLKEEQWQ